MEIIYVLIGLVSGYLIYAKGVKDGKAFAEHKKVDLLPKPIENIKQNKLMKESKKEEKHFIDAVNNMLNYDGFKQKEGE